MTKVNSTGRRTILKYLFTQDRATKYIKHILVHLKCGSNNNIKKVGDFNTSFSKRERSSKPKISKEM